MTGPAYFGDVDRHDHAGNSSVCRACIAEGREEHEGGILWDEWCAELAKKLGYLPKAYGVTNDQHLPELGVDRKDATEMWARNFTVDAYMRLRKLKRAPRVMESGVVRLFNDTDEKCSPLGQQVSMHVRFLVDDLIKWALDQNPNISLRDLEYLVFSNLQMATARQILMRRRHR